MSPLTVLHVNTEGGFRGGEIQNLHLADGLRRRGHRSVLAAQAGSGLARRAADASLDLRERRMRGEFDLGAAAWLAGLLRAERPHVVHCHTSHAVTLVSMAQSFQRSAAAVATRRTSFPTRRNPLFRFKFTWGLDHIIAVSGSIRDDLVQARIPAERITVVHSGIDLGRFRDSQGGEAFRREIEVAPDALLVGCVGALAPQKGHHLLLRSVAVLAPEFPALHAALVGEGRLMAELLDDARGLGIGDRIHLTGFREDISRATAAFDVAVLPSVSGEGSPAAVKEAMAGGVPIVATDIGGVREILQDGVQGLLIRPGDEPVLTGSLRRLLGDENQRRRMGQAGRARAQEFSMERMIERTEAVYHRVCEARP